MFKIVLRKEISTLSSTRAPWKKKIYIARNECSEKPFNQMLSETLLKLEETFSRFFLFEINF